MEVAARVGGGHDAELCAVATGVDLNALAIDVALGGAVSAADMARCQGTRTCPERRGRPLSSSSPPKDGSRTSRASRAEALPGVEWVRVYRRPGHVFGPLRRGSDRAGAVLATGGSRQEALERARRAADAVRFRVDANEA